MLLTSNEQLVVITVGNHCKGNEITGAMVAKVIGMKARDASATVWAMVDNVRRKGYPVCANSKGYYWPRDQDEIMDYQQSLQNRLDKIQKAYDGIELALEVSRRQPPLEMIQQLSKNVREV